MSRDIQHALSFGKAVGDYDRGRPSYPDTAIDWLLEHAPERPVVVDVGAGTGKFTASLVARGVDVTAVDPDAEMLAKLAQNLPSVHTAAGSGESLPLTDASADLVTFAQAWHWVDVEEASREVARVLRPGGVLGLIWNIRDESVDWVAELSGVMGASEAERFDSLTPPVGDALERADYAEFRWENPVTRAQLLAMVTSRSYVITMPPDEREA
ncbi:MAG: SAM-dependent methyltransferase, partial [Microbacteriaceae bacterium]|nr:SAM-dependent methyltransferase [Microbacteriaceae bacterium]